MDECAQDILQKQQNTRIHSCTYLLTKFFEDALQMTDTHFWKYTLVLFLARDV